jgi:ribonuclease HI
LGVVDATIYVDTSFNGGTCQTGYYIYFNEQPLIGYSNTFSCSDNNSAEVTGILLACQKAVEVFQQVSLGATNKYYFTVHNDNITAVTVSDSKYKPSKKANGKFKLPREIKTWCEENNVTLKCIRKKRGDCIMKKCDKLSKSYRKGGFCE